ncbi:MAG: hypothetical protein ABEJ26_11230 [Halosimplex sp.]
MYPENGRSSGVGRRGFLAAAAGVGAAALAGCTVTLSDDQISVRPSGDGGSTSAPAAKTPAATATPEPADPTPTPEPTDEELVLQPMTVEAEPVDAVVITPEPTPTATAAPTPTPEPGSSRFRVHNVKLKVVSADDGDVFTDDEELFGSVWVLGFDSRTGFFEPEGGGAYGYADGVVKVIDRDDPLVVEEGKTVGLNVDEIVSFSDPAGLDRSASYISVGASLSEKDDIADDTFGKYYDGYEDKWRLADEGSVTGGKVTFKDGGSHVRLTFDVTPLD